MVLKEEITSHFVDLENAFDQIPRKIIEWALRRKGVPEKIAIPIIELCRVQVTGENSRWNIARV